MKAIEDIAYSGWNLHGGSQESEREDLYFNNWIAVKVLEELMGH